MRVCTFARIERYHEKGSAMRIFECGVDSLHVGHDLAPGLKEEEVSKMVLELFPTDVISILMTNAGFLGAYYAWGERSGLEGIALLEAHGGWSNGQWLFGADAPLDTPVQNWVDAFDGRYRLLILCCCNPENRGTITAKRSLVIHLRSSLLLENVFNRRSKQRIFIPGYGYYDADDPHLKAVTEVIRQGPQLKILVES